MRAALVLSLAAGCVSRGSEHEPIANPERLVDSTDAVFGWQCGDDGCDLEIVPETPPPLEGATAWTGYAPAWGRFFTVCGVNETEGGWATATPLCKPVTCNTDDDCPQLYEYRDLYLFECRSSVCQSTDLETFPAQSIDRIDVELMCYAPFQREDFFLDFATVSTFVMNAVEEACGPDAPLNASCNQPLPDGCLQP